MIAVKELIVRATVLDNNLPMGSKSDLSEVQNMMREEERELIISDCIEQVLEIIRREKER